MIPVIQWSVYCCDNADHIIGWTGGRPIITSSIVEFSEPIATSKTGIKYLIHPDSQGVNFQALFMLDRWLAISNFNRVTIVTEKYFLSDY